MVTLVKVVWLPDVDKHKCHELKLWQPLSGWTGQGQKVPQVGNLGVDQIPSHLGRASGTLSAAAATSTAIKTKKRKKKWAATTWMIAGMHADEAIKNTRKLHKQGRLNYGQPASSSNWPLPTILCSWENCFTTLTAPSLIKSFITFEPWEWVFKKVLLSGADHLSQIKFLIYFMKRGCHLSCKKEI
jgi:hypothetical protein